MPEPTSERLVRFPLVAGGIYLIGPPRLAFGAANRACTHPYRTNADEFSLGSTRPERLPTPVPAAPVRGNSPPCSRCAFNERSLAEFLPKKMDRRIAHRR